MHIDLPFPLQCFYLEQFSKQEQSSNFQSMLLPDFRRRNLCRLYCPLWLMYPVCKNSKEWLCVAFWKHEMATMPGFSYNEFQVLSAEVVALKVSIADCCSDLLHLAGPNTLAATSQFLSSTHSNKQGIGGGVYFLFLSFLWMFSNSSTVLNLVVL